MPHTPYQDGTWGFLNIVEKILGGGVKANLQRRSGRGQKTFINLATPLNVRTRNA